MASDGAWTSTSDATASAATLRTSSRAGAVVRSSFTGRGVALVMPTGPLRGRVHVRVDGVAVRTSDLRSDEAVPRRLVYQRTWPASGTHRIELRVEGTSGRPRIDLDGFVIVQ